MLHARSFRTSQLAQQGKPLGIIACFSRCCVRKHTASVPCPNHAGCCFCALQVLSDAESACEGNKDREPHCVDTQIRTPCAYEVPALLAAACTEHARGKALLRLQGALASRPCNTVQRSKHLRHSERLAAHKLRHVLASLERHVARIPGLVPQLAQCRRRASRYLCNDAVDRRATETELDALVRRRNLPAHQVDGGCQALGVVVADDAQDIGQDPLHLQPGSHRARTSKRTGQQSVWCAALTLTLWIDGPVARIHGGGLEHKEVLVQRCLGNGLVQAYGI